MARRNQTKTNQRQASLFDDFEYREEEFDVRLPQQDSTHSEQEKKVSLADARGAKTPSQLRFISFGSGSSGNCAYIGTQYSGILVDAGVDIKKVFGALKEYDIRPENIKGIILSHDHGDHVRYVYSFVRKYPHLSVYCTNLTLGGLLRRHNISRRIKDRQIAIFKEIPFHLAGLTITAFDVSHDGTDNAGFFVEFEGLKFAIATDLGKFTPRAEHYLKQANFMMLESNYDSSMLINGAYPEYLKSRIMSDHGHLDNQVAADFVRDNYSEDLQYVFLCHLSNDNNTPEKARETFVNTLSAAGITSGKGELTVADNECDLQIVTLPRYDATRLYILRGAK